YCSIPLDCFLCLLWTVVIFFIVSLYAIFGSDNTISTLNIFFNLSVITVNCTFPCPPINNCFVSTFLSKTNVGSSSVNLCKEDPIFSSSPLDFGSTALYNVGLG